MKIFNTEQGKKKVYIHMEDIRIFMKYDIDIPDFLIEKVFYNPVSITNNTKTNFIEFSEPKEIEYFESVDWILDYKKVRTLSEKEILKLGQKITNDKNNLGKVFNSLTEAERKKEHPIWVKCKLMEYKISCLAEFLKMKKMNQGIELPLVPDSDGFTFDGNKIYEMKQSIDPNKLLVYRKDGNKLCGTDKIDQNFVQSGISIAIMQRNKSNSFAGDFETSFSISEDKKYLVIEFKVKEYKTNESIENNNKGFKTKLKSIFTRNKK